METSIQYVLAFWLGSTFVSIYGCWQALKRIAKALESNNNAGSGNYPRNPW